MPIPVVCPSCQHKFAVPDTYAGKRGKCPECASVFRAPTAESVLVAAQAQAATGAPPLPEDDIPVGTAIDEPPIAGDSVVAPAPPAAPFILETPAYVAGKAMSSVRRPPPSAAGTNPLLLAGIGGGVVLVIGMVAVGIWASGALGDSTGKKVADAGKQPKKAAATDDDPEDDEPHKATPASTGASPTKPSDKPAAPGKPAEPGEPAEKPADLGPLPEFEKPEAPIPPPVLTPPPAPPADALTVESIEKLADECDKMGWKPADGEQFRKLQLLGRLVAQAKSAEENPANPEEERTKLGAAADVVLKTLSETYWASDAKLADLNRLSAASLTSDELGVFAYGTVMGMTNNAPKLLLVELGGTMETLAIPVKTSDLDTPLGSRWLILGQRVPGQIVSINIQGGGMDRTIRPPLVKATHLIGEPME